MSRDCERLEQMLRACPWIMARKLAIGDGYNGAAQWLAVRGVVITNKDENENDTIAVDREVAEMRVDSNPHGRDLNLSVEVELKAPGGTYSLGVGEDLLRTREDRDQ